MLVVPADVTDAGSVSAAAQRVRDELGPIHLEVLSAGYWKQMDPSDWDTDLFDRHVQVNLTGMSNAIAAVLPGMLRRRSGTIAAYFLVARRRRVSKRGQVAQVVERSPEKAGVGGSTPSLATIIPKDLSWFTSSPLSPWSAHDSLQQAQFTAILPDFRIAPSTWPCAAPCHEMHETKESRG